MKGLQKHPDRDDHILVNLYPTGSMYLKPGQIRKITSATSKYTEVLYSQQRIRLVERADRLQSLIDSQPKVGPSDA